MNGVDVGSRKTNVEPWHQDVNTLNNLVVPNFIPFEFIKSFNHQIGTVNQANGKASQSVDPNWWSRHQKGRSLLRPHQKGRS